MHVRKALLHIVPGYGARQNALLDYALLLDNYFQKSSYKTSFDVRSLPDAYMISYVNAGYSFWEHLANLQLLRKWRKKNIPGLVFFHEAYAAAGKFYQKSFWKFPLEKWVFKAYVRMAPVMYCSCEPLAKHIRVYQPQNIALQITPIPSNIVFEQLLPWQQRKQGLVVFGTFGRRQAAIQKKAALLDLIAGLGLTELIDIGAGTLDYSWLPANIDLRVLGYTDTVAAIATQIGSVKYGLIDYPEHLLNKSGIFAAYAAAGLCVINTDESFQSAQQYTFTITELKNLDSSAIEKRLSAMQKYYDEERSGEVHAAKLLDSLRA